MRKSRQNFPSWKARLVHRAPSTKASWSVGRCVFGVDEMQSNERRFMWKHGRKWDEGGCWRKQKTLGAIKMSNWDIWGQIRLLGRLYAATAKSVQHMTRLKWNQTRTRNALWAPASRSRVEMHAGWISTISELLKLTLTHFITSYMYDLDDM